MAAFVLLFSFFFIFSIENFVLFFSLGNFAVIFHGCTSHHLLSEWVIGFVPVQVNLLNTHRLS
jgi:hypothetical protein